MAFSNSGGTLTIPSPTHGHHPDSQIVSLRRSLSRSPSKFNLGCTHSAASTASQHSFCSMSAESSFGGQTPQSPCPRGAPSTIPTASFHHTSSILTGTPRPTPTPTSFRSSTYRQAATSTSGCLFDSTTARAPSIFSTPQPAHKQQPPQQQQSTSFSSSFQRQPFSTQQQPQTQPKTRTPFAPAPPRTGIRLSLRSARFKGGNSSRAVSRNRTPPRSPLKRALSISSDSGNSTTTPSVTPPKYIANGQENTSFPQPSPIPTPTGRVGRGNRHSMHLDISGASNQTIFKLFDSTTPEGLPASTASPLKRNDAAMDVGQPNFESPVAKRRSVHGFGGLGVPENFNIFDHSVSPPNQGFDVHRDEDSHNKEYLLTGATNSRTDSTPASPTPHHQLPRRSGSLRRTAHQRISGRDSWGRRQAAQQLANANPEATTPITKNSRPRLAMDNFPQARDSPFTGGQASQSGVDKPFHPHPLSRNVTTSSSSGSSMPDESPTPQFAAPIKTRRPPQDLNFAKSLPVGSRPPMFPEAVQTPRFDLSKRPVAGPASTGLVSKMHSLPYDESIEAANKVAMPDTPCKKPYNNFATFPPNGSAIKTRHPRPSFNIAATPFNPIAKQPGTFGNPRRVPALFSQLRAQNRSRGPISIDVEERKQGDEMGADSFPPTPTKMTAPHKHQFSTPKASHTTTSRFGVPTSAVGNSLSRQSSFTGNCKYGVYSGNRSFISEDGSPQQKSFRLRLSISSAFSVASIPEEELTDSQDGSSAPNTPCPSSSRAILSSAARAPNTKTFTASPLDRFEFQHATTPRTPQDVAPPDASGLSISNHSDGGHVSMLPPATPTTRHNSSVASRRVITPVNTAAAVDLDEVLVNVYDKVTEVGSGEFSKVYRVVFFSRQSTPTYNNAPTPIKRSPPGPAVFAVKKIKMPLGNRDREEKLKEVNILRALSHENVIRYARSWEEIGNLYIQTEFCEEGSLAGYLELVGKQGRLDDFRIWKMLLEIGAGLQHIHDTGFIHLDMKPANIFVSFDGVLKIGDFGLAASWPANHNIEGEGDREYIGPEILEGKYDKPADIFAVGLIIMEIAANVRLPGNGPIWRNLRSGEMKDVPTLTWDPVNGPPIVTTLSAPDIHKNKGTPHRNNGRRRLFETKKSAEKTPKVEVRLDPPAFMEDPNHTSSLDQVVRWMISPNPSDRPTVHDVLTVEGSLYVSAHRLSGATAFEGKWGPKDPSHPLAIVHDTPPPPPMVCDGDTVMMDV